MKTYKRSCCALTLLQTKLKSAVQLQDLLDATRMLVPRSKYVFKFRNSYLDMHTLVCFFNSGKVNELIITS